MISRRGILAALGFGAGAATAVAVGIPTTPAAIHPAQPPLFNANDAIYRGIPIRQIEMDSVPALSKFQREIMREYVKDYCFNPYLTAGIPSKITDKWVRDDLELLGACDGGREELELEGIEYE